MLLMRRVHEAYGKITSLFSRMVEMGNATATDKPGWRSWWRVGLIGQPTRQSYDVQSPCGV